MLPNEKNQLLALFESEKCWCQDAEARDAYGSPLKFNDPLATAWDITGALCRLFGWKRARTLFGQFERHIHKRKRVPVSNRDATIESMVTLQAYNDAPGRTFHGIRKLLTTMPVWSGVSRTIGQSVNSAGARQEKQRRRSESMRRRLSD